MLQDPGSQLRNNPLPEARARAALEELRNKGHTKADPIAESVNSLAERGHDDGGWWLEQITKAVFRAGMSWRIVDAKWSAFAPNSISSTPLRSLVMDDSAIRRIETDPQVLRNVRKLEAAVINARAMLDLLADHRGFRAYLSSFAEPFWEREVQNAYISRAAVRRGTDGGRRSRAR